jgi:GntR family transcriptional regulator/MocR family aminotransferase
MTRLKRKRVTTAQDASQDSSATLLPVFSLDQRSALPLYRQVSDGFRNAILRGDLLPGQRIPSSREVAKDLRISRFPVLDAYAQLTAEGYFESRQGVGTFVSAFLRFDRRSTDESAERHPGPRSLSDRSQRLPFFGPLPWRNGWGPFGVHQPALDKFPFGVWSRLIVHHSRRPPHTAIHNIEPLGLESLRHAICSYLRTARSVRCDPSQIMIVSGSQQALDITTRVLLDWGSPVWVEDPGYPLLRSVLLASACKLIPVPVDRDGMIVEQGIRSCPQARAAFVTPSHQYPLGATMSASRRLQLLNWAQNAGAWIVEDDYDSEYRYESMPIPSLQGLDADLRVIYIGTFSKVLFPSLRVGYIVIPPDLVERFVAVRFAMDIFPSYLFQEVLTDFMRLGYFARHIHRMRQVYRERRSVLVQSLKVELGDLIEIHGSEAGMHLAVTLPDGYNDVKLAMAAAAQKLWLWPLSPCWLTAPARQGFILGFGSIPEEKIPQSVQHLARVLDLWIRQADNRPLASASR